jgi:regulator of sigma E protease
MSYIITAAIISLIIFIHELGHFAAARAAGIPVEALSLGFGPVLAGKKYRGTEYRLSAIPFGGYLMPAADIDQFFRISPARRILLSLGGPAANILTAIPLFSLLNISKGNASLYDIAVLPFAQTAALLSKMLSALTGMFSHHGDLMGIVGIVSSGNALVPTWGAAAAFAALISLNLALFNLLPLPALDGGKILLAIFEYATPKTRVLQIPLSIASWVLIALLMVYVTILDVGRIVS